MAEWLPDRCLPEESARVSCPRWGNTAIRSFAGSTSQLEQDIMSAWSEWGVPSTLGSFVTSSFLSRAPVIAFKTRKTGLKPSPISLPFVKMEVWRINFFTPACLAASMSLMTPYVHPSSFRAAEERPLQIYAPKMIRRKQPMFVFGIDIQEIEPYFQKSPEMSEQKLHSGPKKDATWSDFRMLIAFCKMLSNPIWTHCMFNPRCDRHILDLISIWCVLRLNGGEGEDYLSIDFLKVARVELRRWSHRTDDSIRIANCILQTSVRWEHTWSAIADKCKALVLKVAHSIFYTAIARDSVCMLLLTPGMHRMASDPVRR